MVAGHLEIRKGYYYAALSYVNSEGKRKRPWVATGLPEKGNKRRAEKALIDIRTNYVIPETEPYGKDMLFADYLLEWVEFQKARVKIATYGSYHTTIENILAPYFRKKKVTLAGLTPHHIQKFQTEKLADVKPNTVIRYLAILKLALSYAVRTDLILANPADKVDAPKKNDFTPSFYSEEELDLLFKAIKGHKLEVIVLLAAFYGLRRGEVIGLKWDAIDFENNTLTIKRTVTTTTLNGKHTVIEQESAKTKSSLRTFPLVAQFKAYFTAIKATQEENKRICGNAYDMTDDGYLFVDAMGSLIRPDYVTRMFPKILKEHNLRHIRFHDLRHSCASLMLAQGVALKQIQEWLGHSDFSTTANIYAHLDASSKVLSAQAMEQTLALPQVVSSQNDWQAAVAF